MPCKTPSDRKISFYLVGHWSRINGLAALGTQFSLFPICVKARKRKKKKVGNNFLDVCASCGFM